MLASLKKLALAALLILAPIQTTIISTVGLVFVDLVTGLFAARKKAVAITSAGLKTTVVKLLVYLAAIILGYLVETYLTGDLYPISKTVSGMVGLTELTSILENLETLTGISFIQALINKLNPPPAP